MGTGTQAGEKGGKKARVEWTVASVREAQQLNDAVIAHFEEITVRCEPRAAEYDRQIAELQDRIAKVQAVKADLLAEAARAPVVIASARVEKQFLDRTLRKITLEPAMARLEKLKQQIAALQREGVQVA